MRIFGFIVSIRRASNAPELEPVRNPDDVALQHMSHAADQMTAAWDQARLLGTTMRPWIIWPERAVVVQQYDRYGNSCVVYDPRAIEEEEGEDE